MGVNFTVFEIHLIRGVWMQSVAGKRRQNGGVEPVA
jgi:hypothetical protein